MKDEPKARTRVCMAAKQPGLMFRRHHKVQYLPKCELAAKKDWLSSPYYAFSVLHHVRCTGTEGSTSSVPAQFQLSIMSINEGQM